MRQLIYIFLAGILLASSCGTTGEMRSSREERDSIRTENVRKALESNQMIIKVNRLHARYGKILDINPDHNFIIIDKDMTRISLAYVGRSYSSRPIAAINMRGKIQSSLIDTRRNGSYDLKIELGQDSEKFTLYMNISRNGFVSLSIVNPRIDFVRYSGTLRAL
ncbi:MAG: DUF4251 domain-containing protein [Bacteroidales bacterium]|nr:DUF4251 domain-containing protein [Bacteroidales bacterium]